jgi:TatD DNase family protein
VDAGINGFMIPAASPEDITRAVELSQRYRNIFFGVGFHPYDIDKFDISLMQKYINHPKCIAVGECGLDYYRLPDEESKKQHIKQKQKEVFISHVDFAKKYKKPLIIHIRDANKDSKDILISSGAKEVGGVLHCYNASEELLELANHNFYFGIGGVVTFKNAKKLVNILKKLPLDKIVVETDSPYLTPTPFRGTRNEPKYTKLVVQKIAEILCIKEEELKDILYNNTIKLFKEFNKKD